MSHYDWFLVPRLRFLISWFWMEARKSEKSSLPSSEEVRRVRGKRTLAGLVAHIDRPMAKHDARILEEANRRTVRRKSTERANLRKNPAPLGQSQRRLRFGPDATQRFPRSSKSMLSGPMMIPREHRRPRLVHEMKREPTTRISRFSLEVILSASH